MTRVTKSASSPQRNNVRGENTRTRLVAAAVETFSTKSFHGTGTRDIAEATGMSQAAMYVHYPTKEDLLYRLSLDGHQEIEDVVLSAASRGKTSSEQLGQIVHDFTVWHARSHTRARYRRDALVSRRRHLDRRGSRRSIPQTHVDHRARLPKVSERSLTYSVVCVTIVVRTVTPIGASLSA